MQVQERTRHIDITMQGAGLEEIKKILLKTIPDAVIIDDDDELIEWDKTDIAKQIKSERTPGLVLQAYRDRAGLSIVELAKKTGIKYTNISAMEHDTRVIGLSTAKRLAKILNCDYTKFIE